MVSAWAPLDPWGLGPAIVSAGAVPFPALDGSLASATMALGKAYRSQMSHSHSQTPERVLKGTTSGITVGIRENTRSLRLKLR